MPADWTWPQAPDGVELTFLAQLNLAEVTNFIQDPSLPTTGWLCFFYDAQSQPWGTDVSDAGRWRVEFFEGAAESLRRAKGPDGNCGTFAACALRFESTITLPRGEFLTSADPSGPFTYEQDDAPAEAGKVVLDNFDYEETFESLIRFAKGAPDHRLLGHAFELKGPMPSRFPNLIRLEPTPPTERTNPFTGARMTVPGKPATQCDESLKRLLTETKDWRLLLQLDSDVDGPGWSWGDAGRIYFWIPTNKLRRHEFDDVWLQLQCR